MSHPGHLLCIVALLATLPTGCKGDRKSSGSKPRTQPSAMGGDAEAEPRPGPAKVTRVAGGRLEVAFLGFGQTPDAKQRLVRYLLTNGARQGIRSVRLRLRYFDRDGKPRGSFPLQVVKPKGGFGAGVTLRETFELLGHKGPPEDIHTVRIEVKRITFDDGSRWP